MNKDRRKKLADAIDQIESAKATIEEALEEEQEFFDSMPESFQSGTRGEEAQAAIDSLTEAVDACDGVVELLDTAKGE